MNIDRFHRWMKSLQTKSTLAIIITAAVLVEATSVVQYWFAREGIRNEVQHRAEGELRAKSLEIQKVMSAVEVAVNNRRWAVEQQLGSPKAMYEITRQMVADNEIIKGCAVAFVPDYFMAQGRQFAPYSFQRPDGRIESKQLGSTTYDYHQMEWYTAPMQDGEPHWSEPYYDKGGGEMMMSTFSVPVCDFTGRRVAVFTADVSLDWLAGVINAHRIYPSSFNLLISRTGQFMACPEESLILKSNIQEATARIEDTAATHLNRRMLAGQAGQATITNNEGSRNYVFFAPVETDSLVSKGRRLGWSMAIVCSENEVYHGLRQVGFNLLLLTIAGLLLLTFIVFRMIRGFNRLQTATSQQQRLARELQIAHAIQVGMLPKAEAFSQRDDVALCASLEPAKEVGGDLYDYYIRDEKLFLCIGDVSGKGIPAALVMAMTKVLFRTVSAHEAAPERIVGLINDTLSAENDLNMFVTLFVGVLDLPTGRMRYCNAGHTSPLLAGASVGVLPADSNIVVGASVGWRYTAQETRLDPMTTLFLFTDGLTEAEDSEHRQFGLPRVRQVAAAISHEPQAFIHEMTEAVRQFVGSAEPSDDLTLLAVQYTKRQLDVRFQRNLTLSNDVNEVAHLTAFVEEICQEVAFDAATTMQVTLAMEEAVVNVMEYAYPAGTKGTIGIEAQANDVRLKFTITDTGAPFDPTTRGEADTSLSLEERPIGGLGIHLVRQLMDSINYERTEGRNVLTLRKKLKNE